MLVCKKIVGGGNALQSVAMRQQRREEDGGQLANMEVNDAHTTKWALQKFHLKEMHSAHVLNLDVFW